MIALSAAEIRTWRPLLSRAGHGGLIERRRGSRWRACCACGYVGRWNGTDRAAFDTLSGHLLQAVRRIHANGAA